MKDVATTVTNERVGAQNQPAAADVIKRVIGPAALVMHWYVGSEEDGELCVFGGCGLLHTDPIHHFNDVSFKEPTVGGLSPETLTVPVSSSFTGPELDFPPTLICRTCAEVLENRATALLHKEKGHRVVWVKRKTEERRDT